MRLFSPEHLAAIAVTALVALLLTVVGRRLTGGVSNDRRPARLGRLAPAATTATVIARTLALAILAGFVVEQVAYLSRGSWSARVNLPLQLSDAVSLVAIAALWRPRTGLLTELTYFWALSASLQAVLTPDLADTFPDVLFVTYFVTHSGAILAACLLVFGLRRLPRPWAVWRVFGLTAAFALLAAIGCVATGGNYMFLRGKPASGSVLDALGPWPWYILGAAAIGLAMLLVLEAIARAVARSERSRA